MALNYSISMLSNPMKPGEAKKAYAKAQISQELTLKELSRLVAGQTTVSRADVSAVLIATVDNMIDSLRAGEQVDFGELGKFRLQITSRGAETAEKFTAANITGVNIQFVLHPCADTRGSPCRAQSPKGRGDNGRYFGKRHFRRRFHRWWRQ